MELPTSRWEQPALLESASLRLESANQGHAWEVLAAADDPEIFRWLPMPHPADLSAAEDLVSFCVDRPNSWAFVQRDPASGVVVGMTGFHDMNQDQRSVAIGPTWFARSRWGTGVNVVSKAILLRHAFEELGCVRVAWLVDTENPRSTAAVEKLRVHHEGVLRKQRRRLDGTWRDVHVFSALDDDWPALHDRLARMQR